MTSEQIALLKANIDKQVRITAADGEVLVVKLILVSEEEEDIIYDLISTNRPDKYERLEVRPAYALPFYAIKWIQTFEPDATMS